MLMPRAMPVSKTEQRLCKMLSIMPCAGSGRGDIPQASLLVIRDHPQSGIKSLVSYRVSPCLAFSFLWTLSRGVLIYKQSMSSMRPGKV